MFNIWTDLHFKDFQSVIFWLFYFSLQLQIPQNINNMYENFEIITLVVTHYSYFIYRFIRRRMTQNISQRWRR